MTKKIVTSFHGLKIMQIKMAWLKNGIWALALAGLYSVILVILRSPWMYDLLNDKSVFKSSLIIHVNLSVLVWLLSIVCIIWSYSNREIIFAKTFHNLAFVGMVLMAVSPLLGSSNPVMNNYVPMLENIWFIIGLSLFGTSLLCYAILVLVDSFASLWQRDFVSVILPIVKITSALMYVMTWICFFLSYKELTDLSAIFPMDVNYYYELLFWSGGHLLQFVYVQIAMFVWIVLLELWFARKLHYYKPYSALFVLNFVLGLVCFYGHLVYPISDYEFKEFFTAHMKYCAGAAPSLFLVVFIMDAFKNRNKVADNNLSNNLSNRQIHKIGFISASIIASMLLFFAGGGIGTMISGTNVSIPAHYHGSIVGISVALLGFAYVFCFQTSITCFVHMDNHSVSACLLKPMDNDSSSTMVSDNQETLMEERVLYEKPLLKWAKMQIYVITIGQFLHIAGLALAGGYGVLRKNPGEEMTGLAKLYMGMVGGGGLVAIIGGLMFVYICARTVPKIIYSSYE